MNDHKIVLTFTCKHPPLCPVCLKELPTVNPPILRGVFICPDCHRHVPHRALIALCRKMRRNMRGSAVTWNPAFCVYSPSHRPQMGALETGLPNPRHLADLIDDTELARVLRDDGTSFTTCQEPNDWPD